MGLLEVYIQIAFILLALFSGHFIVLNVGWAVEQWRYDKKRAIREGGLEALYNLLVILTLLAFLVK